MKEIRIMIAFWRQNGLERGVKELAGAIEMIFFFNLVLKSWLQGNNIYPNALN